MIIGVVGVGVGVCVVVWINVSTIEQGVRGGRREGEGEKKEKKEKKETNRQAKWSGVRLSLSPLVKY